MTARLLARNLIAAVAMLACALAPTVPFLIPAYAQWMSVDRTGVEGTWQFLAEIARFPISIAAAALLLWLALRIERARWRDYFGHAGTARAWGVLLVTTAAAAAVTVAGSTIAHLSGLDAGRPTMGDTSGVPLALVFAYGLARAFLLQGVQEEWWFRGFAFRGHEQRPWLVLGVTTVVFTLLHLTSQGGQTSPREQMLYLVLPLGMGLWAGVERWFTGTVWGAVGIHGGIHTGLMVPALLGWPQGPAAWVAIGGVLCVAAVVRLLLRRDLWTGAPSDAPAR